MTVMERKEAKALGLVRFNSGRPCMHGHMSDRFTISGNCIACCHAKQDRTRKYGGRTEKGGLPAKEFHKRTTRKWRETHPERAREVSRKSASKSRRLKQYGLTPEDYAARLEAQGRVCAICNADRPHSKYDWSVDHCHQTNRVRGILCGRCNLMLGHAKDNPTVLRAAALYLERT